MGAVDLDLVGRHHDEVVGLAGRDHWAEHFAAKPDIAADRAAALAHAMQLALLHIEPAPKGNVRDNAGRLEHALAAETGDDDVGDAVGHAGSVSAAWQDWFAARS